MSEFFIWYMLGAAAGALCVLTVHLERMPGHKLRPDDYYGMFMCGLFWPYLAWESTRLFVDQFRRK